MVAAADALRALRTQLTGYAFWRATALEVVHGGGERFLVRVRSDQRRRPHTVVVPADASSLAHDLFIGEPLEGDDAEAWADGVARWLQEEIDTGLLRWGQRIDLGDGTVAIDPMAGRPSRADDGAGPWSIVAVPLDRPTAAAEQRLRRQFRWRLRLKSLLTGGGWTYVVAMGDDLDHEPDPRPGGALEEVGLDVTAGREAARAGRLIAWLQLYEHDDVRAQPLGHVVVRWEDAPGETAQLACCEVVDDPPIDALEALRLAGLHAAADAGARWIDDLLVPSPWHADGLPWQSHDGVRRLDADEVP